MLRVLWVYVLLLGSSVLVFAQPLVPADPGTRGQNGVNFFRYDLGDEAFQPRDLSEPVEIRAIVAAPTDGDNLPIVVLFHGRHTSCFNPDSNRGSLIWPCRDPAPEEIPSYRGYDYLADHLASRGFVAVSIGANGISAQDNETDDAGAFARAQLLQQHIALLQQANRTPSGPLGSDLVNRLDLSRIGVFAHSRAGEGTVVYSESNIGLPLRAILAVGSTNFNNLSLTRGNLGSILPYCDGDVVRLDSARLFDDTIAPNNANSDTNAHFQWVWFGANHNFFNTVWTPNLFPAAAQDDWQGFIDNRASDPHCGTNQPQNQRLNPAQQRSATVVFSTAFFEFTLSQNTSRAQQNQNILTGVDTAPESSELGQNGLTYSFHLPDPQRLDIDRINSDRQSLRDNEVGGFVSSRGVSALICGESVGQSCIPNATASQDPHRRAVDDLPDTLRISLNWFEEDGAFFEQSLPDLDVSEFDTLQFRVGVNLSVFPTNGRALFFVELADRSGNLERLAIDNPEILSFPPGRSATSRNALPRSLLNVARVSLERFQRVDLTRLSRIRLLFSDNTRGGVLVRDIAFSRLSPSDSS